LRKSDYDIRHVCPSARPSACTNSAPIGKIFIDIIWAFLENLTRNFEFHWNLIKITGTLHGDVLTFMTISRWILRRISNVSDKTCTENPITHILCSIPSFWKSRCLWDHVEKCCTTRQATRNTITRSISFECWVSKVAGAHTHPCAHANAPAYPEPHARESIHTH
jgi:hypothetical protein